MADVALSMDLNTTQAVGNAKKLKSELKSVGDGMAQAGKQIEQTGKQTNESIGKSVLNMGKLVIAAKLVGHALGQANDKLNEFMAKSAQASEQKGGAALRASQAAAEGGMNQNMVSAFLANQVGAASQDEKAALVEKIAKEDPGISPQRFIELTTALNSGAFSSSQVDEALKSGESLDIQKRRGELSSAALREIATRENINALNAQSGGGAATFRVSAAARDAKDREDPGMAALRGLIPNAVVDPLMNPASLKLALDMQKDKLNMSGVTDNHPQ